MLRSYTLLAFPAFSAFPLVLSLLLPLLVCSCAADGGDSPAADAGRGELVDADLGGFDASSTTIDAALGVPDGAPDATVVLVCPEYSPVNAGIGSSFEYDQSTATTTGSLETRISSRRSGGTIVKMDFVSTTTGSDYTSTASGVQTFRCDEQGLWLTETTSTYKTTTSSGTTTVSYKQEFDGFRTMARDLSPGKRWTSNYSIRTTTNGMVTNNSGTVRYHVRGPRSETTPAGSFDGIEIEVDGSSRFVVAPSVGSVRGSNQFLKRYSLK